MVIPMELALVIPMELAQAIPMELAQVSHITKIGAILTIMTHLLTTTMNKMTIQLLLLLSTITMTTMTKSQSVKFTVGEKTHGSCFTETKQRW